MNIHRPGQKILTMGKPGLQVISPRWRTAEEVPVNAIVWDAFKDANNTTLPNHSPDVAPSGSSWDNANIGIIGNEAHLLSGSRQIATIEAGISDCRISVYCCQDPAGVYLTSAAYRSGIIARYTNSTNFWRIAFHPSAGFAIYEVNNGVLSLRASASFTSSYGTFHTVSVILNGNTIYGEIDGSHQVSYGSATHNQNATRHGFAIANSGSIPAADNFLIESL